MENETHASDANDLPDVSGGARPAVTKPDIEAASETLSAFWQAYDEMGELAPYLPISIDLCVRASTRLESEEANGSTFADADRMYLSLLNLKAALKETRDCTAAHVEAMQMASVTAVELDRLTRRTVEANKTLREALVSALDASYQALSYDKGARAEIATMLKKLGAPVPPEPGEKLSTRIRKFCFGS